MNYDNYKQKIAETYGVALQKYPLGAMQNPGKIGRCEDLIKLLNNLVNSHCFWVRLTEDEIVEHKNRNKEHQACGEQVYKPWKQQTKCLKATKESGA
ncbi:uncharacterized protein F5147DRAFT_538049, partial [Suillus discolor]